MPSSAPVWFITGCSTGFGRELAQQVLAKGWRVAATARDKGTLDELVAGAGDHALALTLDVTDQAQIDAAVDRAKAHFGTIDVLVNNAGYGYQSAVEEGVEADIRAQFDTNVFGLFALTRKVLPIMRERRSGHIISVSSISGLLGLPGSGYYAASKHAVEGWSDSLAMEVGPIGIKVTCIEPGPFRTDWAGRSLHQTPNRIADYADTAGRRLQGTKDISGTQAGDPVRAAAAMIALTEEAHPPRHLVLGAFGYGAVVKRLRERLEEIESHRQTALDTDFPEG